MAVYSETKAKIRLWLAPWKYRMDRHSKYAFVASMNRFHAEILDVGCGVDSVRKLKTQAPLAHFDGIDIEHYQMSKSGIQAMRHYWIVDKTTFADDIKALPQAYDGIVLSHVIEHLDQPEAFLDMLLTKLKPGGSLYVSTPCLESVHFPSIEKGCLNFYDDETHISPVDILAWSKTLKTDFSLHRSVERNRGNVLLQLLGWLSMPVVWLGKRYTPFLWYVYGFETVIWVRKMGES